MHRVSERRRSRDGFLETFSRVVVSLIWILLVVVVVFVAYLAARFY
jgi:hypothetical protein